MKLTWIVLTIFHFISIGFLGLAIMKIYGYLRLTRLEENRHTLLFSVLKIEHGILVYIVFIILYTFGSMLFINFLETQ